MKRMTSEAEIEERYSQEVNKITQGIKSLVTNLNEGPSSNKCLQTPFQAEGNFLPSSASRSYPQKDNYNGYNYNNKQNYPAQGNRRQLQADCNSSPYDTKKFQTSGTGNMDSRILNPRECDDSMKRISDLSISSSTSYSSQSSTDEINGILRQTHIAVYRFNERHEDEVGLEVGDAVYLYKVLDDTWFEGNNLRTGQSGIFPSRYVSDILQSPKKRDSSSSPLSSVSSETNQFYLRFLGSVEVEDFKGDEVLCSAMKEIVKQHQVASITSPPYCTLDITIHGIKITEHQGHPSRSFNTKKPMKTKTGKLFDKDQQDLQETCHFFDLRNVTFCGCHPNNSRYFAFITKHPEDSRFACHVFMSEFSTEPVAFAIGKAFKEFYHEFLDCQGPT